MKGKLIIQIDMNKATGLYYQTIKMGGLSILIEIDFKEIKKETAMTIIRVMKMKESESTSFYHYTQPS